MELRRIVVGVDGSGTSRAALDRTLAVAERTGAEVVAVHALGLLDELHDPSVPDEQWRADLRRRVEAIWCAPLMAAGAGHRVELRDGPAADVVLATAAAEGADLVVVGRRGVGVEPAQALGSTSLRILQAARVPVLVVPGDGAAPPRTGGGRVLVGVDPADPSLGALDVAAEIAAVLGAALVAVAAVPGPDADVGALQAALTARGLPPAGVEVGEPATVLLAAAERIDADLVAVGTRHQDAAADLLLGSVARTVAGRAGRPTLVVPAGRVPQPG